MDGWNTSFLLGWPIFRGYVSFREGNDSPNSPWRFHRKNHKNTPLKIQLPPQKKLEVPANRGHYITNPNNALL